MTVAKKKLYQLATVVVVTLLLVISSVTFALFKADKLNDDWYHYSQSVVTKQKLLSEIRSAMGYDGMIHHFKNYLLRQTPGCLNKTDAAINRALSNIILYEELVAPTETEITGLNMILGVINQYRDNLLTAQSMMTKGIPPLEIDKVVKVDDTPAIEGLKKLSSQLNEATEDHTRMVNDDAQQIFFIIMALPIIILACMFLVLIMVIRI